ncbi:ImmA/IrrE family metallo-endopeptidase [Helicobacter typhlonius]|uniref:ImmA/IrrE family metallo-endopeptidase n=1 Tax=Helicobacter typhlonius TaxID=76936 RepID=UPI002FDFC4C8
MAFIEDQALSESSSQQNNIYEIYKKAQQNNISIKPFDIFSYIKTLDSIRLLDEYLENDISGIIEKFTHYYQITLNKYHSNLRRRFTLAHELGHFLLHKQYLENNKKIEDAILFRRQSNINCIELEANEFAAELLMPKDDFEKEVKNGNNTIEKLSSCFQVSFAAVKYRAFKLGYLKEY